MSDETDPKWSDRPESARLVGNIDPARQAANCEILNRIPWLFSGPRADVGLTMECDSVELLNILGSMLIESRRKSFEHGMFHAVTPLSDQERGWVAENWLVMIESIS